MKLVIASNNRGKIKEIKESLGSLDLELYTLNDFPSFEMPEESGITFEENALIKARFVALKLKMWALADDSGLVVEALDGQPGIYSARYAKIGATDAENRKKLLFEMQGLNGEKRKAFFVGTFALVSPDLTEKVVKATCLGYICKEERGEEGFGYDPLFIPLDYNKTFAQLGIKIKDTISHRAKALKKMKQIINDLCH